MTVQTTSLIILHPVKERSIINQYRKDKGWKCVTDCTIAVAFELKSPQYITDAVYIPSDNPYDRHISEEEGCIAVKEAAEQFEKHLEEGFYHKRKEPE